MLQNMKLQSDKQHILGCARGCQAVSVSCSIRAAYRPLRKSSETGVVLLFNRFHACLDSRNNQYLTGSNTRSKHYLCASERCHRFPIIYPCLKIRQGNRSRLVMRMLHKHSRKPCNQSSCNSPLGLETGI